MQDNSALFDRITRLIDSGNLKLPVFNPIAIKLQEAIASNSGDIQEIEQLILSDQVAAAEVLRAANSPFFCGLSPVRTIRNAIVRLGIQQMRRIVILVFEREKYKAKDPELHAMMMELWRHASTTALASQWLSRRLRLTGIEEICFIGGLLHDIGKLIILHVMDAIQESEGQRGGINRESLNEILRFAHCDLGYRLLVNWHVPAIYCQIARDHHSLELSEDLPLAIVRLANAGSRKLGLGLDPNPSLVLSETAEADLLQVGQTLFDELQAMIEEHLILAA